MRNLTHLTGFPRFKPQSFYNRNQPCSDNKLFYVASSPSIAEFVLSHGLWNNDLLFSVSMCWSRTCGHPSKYWLSAKGLELGRHLATDIYYTPDAVNLYMYIYILADRWSRTNPNFAQTQTSNKPKVRTNLNFEQTQTSNKPESLWP